MNRRRGGSGGSVQFAVRSARQGDQWLAEWRGLVFPGNIHKNAPADPAGVDRELVRISRVVRVGNENGRQATCRLS